MRTVGFTDLDGNLVVSALPPQHPGGGAGGKGSSTANKRQLSWRLPSSFRAARQVTGGGNGGGNGDGNGGGHGGGGTENVPPAKKTASAGPTRGVGSASLDIVEAATAAAAAAATTKAAPTPTVRPPLGRRNWGRPGLKSSSRPPRVVHSSSDSNSGDGGGDGSKIQDVLGGFSARWVAVGRARRRDAAGGGCGGSNGRGGAGCAKNRGGFVSSPASPASPITLGPGGSWPSPFAAAAAAAHQQRAFSMR